MRQSCKFMRNSIINIGKMARFDFLLIKDRMWATQTDPDRDFWT